MRSPKPSIASSHVGLAQGRDDRPRSPLVRHALVCRILHALGRYSKTHWVATGNGTIPDPGKNILEEDIDDVFVASGL